FAAWGRSAEPDATAAASHDKQVRYVSRKWASNRASLIRTHVLPALGPRHLDDLTIGDLSQLQRDLVRRRLSPATVDRVVHSALRALLRDAGALGYRIPDLTRLYSAGHLQRLDRDRDVAEIDPFTEPERE